MNNEENDLFNNLQYQSFEIAAEEEKESTKMKLNTIHSLPPPPPPQLQLQPPPQPQPQLSYTPLELDVMQYITFAPGNSMVFRADTSDIILQRQKQTYRGMRNVANLLSNCIVKRIRYPILYKKHRINTNFAIIGKSGSGKRSFVLDFCEEMNIATIYISYLRHRNNLLDDVVKFAIKKTPCLIYLDGFDLFFSNIGTCCEMVPPTNSLFMEAFKRAIELLMKYQSLSESTTRIWLCIALIDDTKLQECDILKNFIKGNVAYTENLNEMDVFEILRKEISDLIPYNQINLPYYEKLSSMLTIASLGRCPAQLVTYLSEVIKKCLDRKSMSELSNHFGLSASSSSISSFSNEQFLSEIDFYEILETISCFQNEDGSWESKQIIPDYMIIV